jgi:hypothetical protein
LYKLRDPLFSVIKPFSILYRFIGWLLCETPLFIHKKSKFVIVLFRENVVGQLEFPPYNFSESMRREVPLAVIESTLCSLDIA